MEPTTITFIVIVGVIAAFYLMIVRPGRQEQRRVEDTIRDLHIGDEVITTAGFFATVREIQTPEEGPVELVLDFGNGLRVRSLTSSIMRRINTAPEPAEQPEEAKGA
jgi:preprotein translocase subunit YajC